MAAAVTAATSSSGPERWSDLPDDLLHSILLRLSHSRDLLAFSSVCRSWRSLATSTISASPTSLFPPLLICPLLQYLSRRRRRCHVSALQLIDPAIPPPIRPVTTLNRSPIEESILTLPFISSSHGHLLFLSRQCQILIFNFITGRQIISPALPMDYDQQLRSRAAQLTAPVSSPNCTLIFLTVDYLLMWRINSPDWALHRLQVPLKYLKQMVVVETRIWALELGYTISLIELPQDSCSNVPVMQWPECKWGIIPCFKNVRLVDCEGEILRVCFVSYDQEWKVQVEVSRIDVSNNQLKFVKKINLGNRALFLSDALNVPGCVCNNPERWGGKKNCIYYAGTASTLTEWSVLEVGKFAPRSLFNQADRSTCYFPFWDFASILQ